jgi:hypothetical protein
MLIAATVGLLASGPALRCLAVGQPRMSEDKLEASMLLQLTRFVVWPQTQPSASNIRICVHGSERLTGALKSISQNEVVQGKPVTVTNIVRANALSGCDVAWFGALSEREFEAVNSTATRNAVLTVSDLETFTARGGMVGLVPRDGRMSIEINREASEQAGLQFSSKVLRLARLVSTAGVR